MNDPYTILGVNRNASDEEIKNAYRNLAKKYHPDNYSNTPLSDFANDKMKEINDAYDAIMNERRNFSNSTASGNYAGEGSSDNAQYNDIRKMIQRGKLDEAEAALNAVAVSGRNAHWYFLKGSVLYSRGWLDEAERHFAQANMMDPSNREYSAAYNRIRQQKQGNFGGYRTAPNTQNQGCACSGCDVCSSLICADCCCECMGGDLLRCC